MRKITSFLVLAAFIFNCIVPPQGFAQAVSAMGLMPPSGTSVALTPAFTPAHLSGMTVHPNDPFRFDFLIHRGDAPLTEALKQEEYARLVKYFLAALAVPDTEQWVNLSPYEQDRIIPDSFGRTEMGRDLLAQDYLLKQLASSLTDPDTDLGRKFWDGVYAQVQARFGRTDMIAETFNKVWIVPNKAVLFEKGSTVYVLENHMKAMTEKDYLAMKNNTLTEKTSEETAVADISSQVMKEIILPAIEKEANEGKSFAPLRQVFSGMLLATWYKKALKDSILGKLYADQGKVKGVDQDPRTNEAIYAKYVQAFKQGVYNMIREDVDKYSQEAVPRKYFSGGSFNPYSMVDNTLIMEKDQDKAESVLRSDRQNVDLAAVVLKDNVDKPDQEDALDEAEATLLDGTKASAFMISRLADHVKKLPKNYTINQVKRNLNRLDKAIVWEQNGSWRDPFWSLLGARNIIVAAGLGVEVGAGRGRLVIFEGARNALRVAMAHADEFMKNDDGSWVLPELIRKDDPAMLVEGIKSDLKKFDWTTWNASGVLTLTPAQARGMGIVGLRLFQLQLELFKGSEPKSTLTPEESILMQYANKERNDRDHTVAEINMIRDMITLLKNPDQQISDNNSYNTMLADRLGQALAYENDFFTGAALHIEQSENEERRQVIGALLRSARRNLRKVDFIDSHDLPFFELMVVYRLKPMLDEKFDFAMSLSAYDQRDAEIYRDLENMKGPKNKASGGHRGSELFSHLKGWQTRSENARKNLRILRLRLGKLQVQAESLSPENRIGIERNKRKMEDAQFAIDQLESIYEEFHAKEVWARMKFKLPQIVYGNKSNTQRYVKYWDSEADAWGLWQEQAFGPVTRAQETRLGWKTVRTMDPDFKPSDSAMGYSVLWGSINPALGVLFGQMDENDQNDASLSDDVDDLFQMIHWKEFADTSLPAFLAAKTNVNYNKRSEENAAYRYFLRIIDGQIPGMPLLYKVQAAIEIMNDDSFSDEEQARAEVVLQNMIKGQERQAKVSERLLAAMFVSLNYDGDEEAADKFLSAVMRGTVAGVTVRERLFAAKHISQNLDSDEEGAFADDLLNNVQRGNVAGATAFDRVLAAVYLSRNDGGDNEKYADVFLNDVQRGKIDGVEILDRVIAARYVSEDASGDKEKFADVFLNDVQRDKIDGVTVFERVVAAKFVSGTGSDQNEEYADQLLADLVKNKGRDARTTDLISAAAYIIGSEFDDESTATAQVFLDGFVNTAIKGVESHVLQRVLAAGYAGRFPIERKYLSSQSEQSQDVVVIPLDPNDALVTEMQQAFDIEISSMSSGAVYVRNIKGRIFNNNTEKKLEELSTRLYDWFKDVKAAQEKEGTVDRAELRGGIDLAQSNLEMQIKRDGAGVPLPVSQQDLENIRIDGLVPVILNIQPATNFPLFTSAGISTP